VLPVLLYSRRPGDKANETNKEMSNVNAAAKLIPGLTGLRGVAALWVVQFHLYGTESQHLSTGYLGVDVFFILSGFVLSHVYAEKFRSASFGTYLSFLKARVARIFPLHLVVLSFVAMVVIALPGFADHYSNPDERFGLTSFIASAFLIQNWFHWLPTSWNSPAWSLSAEWFAYLTFPIFVIATQRWRTIGVTLTLAIVSLCAFIALLIVRKQYDPGVDGTTGMFRMGTEFGCGCLLYRAQALGMRILPIWADGITVALLGISLYVPGAIFLSLFCIAGLVLLAAQSRGPIAKLLSIRPIVFLGEISYSIYLVHWLLIQISNWAAVRHHLMVQIGARDVCVVALTLVISYGTYDLIELRSRAWGRRIGLARPPGTSS
jgi:peptidoglycan/LPS O-acetylase OafA/YrhL